MRLPGVVTSRYRRRHLGSMNREPFEHILGRPEFVETYRWNSPRKIPHKIPHTRSADINQIDRILTKALQSKDCCNEINWNNGSNRSLNP